MPRTATYTASSEPFLVAREGPLFFGPQELASSDPSGPLPLTSLDADETAAQPTEPSRLFAPQADNAAIRFRHSGWHRRRERLLRVMHRHEPTLSTVNAVLGCGCAAWVQRDAADPRNVRISCNTCRHRLCEPCARTLGNRYAHRIADLLPTHDVRFVTLTLRATNEPLTLQIDRLYEAFKRLRRRKPWRTTQTAGVTLLEITWNDRSKTWHPHLHTLSIGRFLDQRVLAAEWLHVTGDSYIVHIRYVRDHHAAARYVAKYATKVVNHTVWHEDETVREALVALKGRRTVFAWGAWKGRLTEEPEPDGVEWLYVAPLHVVIQRAANGDPEAVSILEALRHQLGDDTYDP